jgi:hypothetical protein
VGLYNAGAEADGKGNSHDVHRVQYNVKCVLSYHTDRGGWARDLHGRKISAYGIFVVVHVRETDNLEAQCINGRIILIWILKIAW